MSLTCGGAAGLISSTATFPLDLIRRRMQLEGQGGIRRYMGYADVARAVFASGGLRGFYAGIIPEYYKVRPCLNVLPQVTITDAPSRHTLLPVDIITYPERWRALVSVHAH